MTRALCLAVILVLAAMPAPAQGPDDGPGRKMPERGRQHVQQGTSIAYQDFPPTSGSHWPVVARWEMFSVEVPAEVYVHNLEHGGIVLLYDCPTPCPDVVRQIEEIGRTLPRSKYGHLKLVVSPNGRLKTRFALLAWTRLDEFDSLDKERVLRFVRAYQDKGPEDVP